MADDNRSKWEYLLFRVLYMILFWLVSRIAWIFIGIFALVQLVYVIIKGEKQPALLNVAQSTVQYSRQCGDYLTFNSEYKPFPFNDWPETEIQESSDDHA